MRLFIAFLLSFLSLKANEIESFISLLNSNADSLMKIKAIDSFMLVNATFPIVKDSNCYFFFRGRADRIIVTGDHTQWSQRGDTMKRFSGTDLHMVIKTFPADARLDYKLINGTNWILDPRNPLICPGGFGPNSELRMPAYPYQPELIGNADIPKGTIFDTTFSSKALNNSRAIKVYLPPNYSSSEQYPVILFHDGIDYVNLAKAPVIIDRLIAMNRIRPIIAVFVPAVNRTPEYAGNSIDAFSSFINEEVMLWVDTRFSTSREAIWRAVAGASNGGNIALYCAMKSPHIFGKVAAQSSNVITSIMKGFDVNPPLFIQTYIDIGTYDIPQLIPLVKQFRQIIENRGYWYQFKQINEGHSWGNWKAHINEYLEFFFPPKPTSVKSSVTDIPLIMNVIYTLDSSTMKLEYDLGFLVKGMAIMLIDVNGRIMSESLLSARELGRQHETLLLREKLSTGAYFLQFRTEQTMFTYPILIQ
jgi:enterochelin esterase family protein